MAPRQTPPTTSQQLTRMWSELNGRYFAGLLPPIDLVWSRRLTSSVGLFVSRRGPRPRLARDGHRPPTTREIRLSLPLLQQVVQRSAYGGTRDREHAGTRNDSSMAIRHPEAATESWTGFSPQDDRDESGRRPGYHRLPFVTEGSPRPHAICLALSAMRPSVPTPATDDSTASAPLWHLPGIITGTSRHAIAFSRVSELIIRTCFTRRTMSCFSRPDQSPLRQACNCPLSS